MVCGPVDGAKLAQVDDQVIVRPVSVWFDAVLTSPLKVTVLPALTFDAWAVTTTAAGGPLLTETLTVRVSALAVADTTQVEPPAVADSVRVTLTPVAAPKEPHVFGEMVQLAGSAWLWASMKLKLTEPPSTATGAGGETDAVLMS